MCRGHSLLGSVPCCSCTTNVVVMSANIQSRWVVERGLWICDGITKLSNFLYWRAISPLTLISNLFKCLSISPFAAYEFLANFPFMWFLMLSTAVSLFFLVYQSDNGLGIGRCFQFEYTRSKRYHGNLSSVGVLALIKLAAALENT